MMVRGTTAFVTVVDESRSFWKACGAFDGPRPAARQNTVEESFCRYVIVRDAPLLVTDARTDPVTCDNGR